MEIRKLPDAQENRNDARHVNSKFRMYRNNLSCHKIRDNELIGFFVLMNNKRHLVCVKSVVLAIQLLKRHVKLVFYSYSKASQIMRLITPGSHCIMSLIICDALLTIIHTLHYDSSLLRPNTS